MLAGSGVNDRKLTIYILTIEPDVRNIAEGIEAAVVDTAKSTNVNYA